MMGRSQKQIVSYVAGALIIIFILFGLLSSQDTITNTLYNSNKGTGLTSPDNGSKYAFCAFLSGTEEEVKEGEEDHYFMGTRMLIYQLLHDPHTRTNTSIDFIVLVAQSVPKEQRDRLHQDGAKVIEAPSIDIDWIKARRARWNRTLDKLHAWTLTQYEKILLLDSDIVITHRLDPLFDEVAAQPTMNLGKKEWALNDEDPQPQEYLMAGSGWPTEGHDYPATRGDKFDGGFVLLKPDLVLYKHYMSIAQIENRFDSSRPEQNLWNYVHRQKQGNMPWQQLHPDWTIAVPVHNDYKNGIASFHEKYWSCERDLELKQVLLRSRWKMEGFFSTLNV